MLKVLPFFLLFLGIAGFVFASTSGAYADGETQALTGKHRLLVPQLSSDRVQQPPTPTPEPEPYQGAVKSIYLASAGLWGTNIVEERDTEPYLDRERLEEPTSPDRIAWYSRFGRPGYRAGNTMFAAHVDYVRYGPAAFWGLSGATIGDYLYLTMDNGLVYTYSVQSVRVIHVDDIDMNEVVYPPLSSDRERVTLISCGGTFIPFPGGGGEYLSRVVLIADRYH
ncbi:hypothetical protein AYO38_04500 [bacterium SCGC AG-212-C10]|nr:hypothetical protein AYO38_04500 [bacterium SCGC AG-212-C10]